MPEALIAANALPPTAWELLDHYARGGNLSDEDLKAMKVGLYQFWRRERYTGFGVSVRDRDDVVQDLMLSVLERKWPGTRLLDGRILNITPALLAQHLQFWLRRRLASVSAYDKSHESLPDEDAGQSDLHAEEEAESSDVEASLAGPHDGLSVSRPTEAFETRCYLAARKCVASLDATAQRVIDLHLGAEYLDDAETNQKLAARQLGMTAVNLTRILQRMGINQPRHQKAAFDEEKWRLSALGSYLIDDCKIQPGDPVSLESAMRTLAWCNRDHLRALKTGHSQTASHP